MKKEEKIKRKISRTERGIYFRVDSVDKVDRGLSAHKLSSVSAYNTIIYLFPLIKRYNYRFALICQHLAMDFLNFPNLSTLVNVCQRMVFHGCNWYSETYRLSTLSTPKCVHIIFRNVFNKKGHLYDDLFNVCIMCYSFQSSWLCQFFTNPIAEISIIGYFDNRAMRRCLNVLLGRIMSTKCFQDAVGEKHTSLLYVVIHPRLYVVIHPPRTQRPYHS